MTRLTFINITLFLKLYFSKKIYFKQKFENKTGNLSAVSDRKKKNLNFDSKN